MSNAEQLYRDAFLRLKKGKPLRLKKGTPVTQNNVAKEAGRDPSALKKNRFPELIREIKLWVEKNVDEKQQSPRQAIIATRNRNRELKDKIEKLKIQRDHALSLLVQADSKILDLVMENARLTALMGRTSKVTKMDRHTRSNKLVD